MMSQLPTLLRIVELRDLGVGLDTIGAVLSARDVDAALRDALIARRGELEELVAIDRARIARIDRRLHPEGESAMSTVEYKSVAPVTVYAAVGYAPGAGPENVGPVVGPLIQGLDRALRAAGRPLIEPGIFWYEPASDDRFAVHASYVAEAEPVAGDGYEVVELPALPTAATLIHRGDMTTIGESWTRLMESIAAAGYEVIGACREVYLEAPGHEPGPDWVTELQAPVARRTEG